MISIFTGAGTAVQPSTCVAPAALTGSLTAPHQGSALSAAGELRTVAPVRYGAAVGSVPAARFVGERVLLVQSPKFTRLTNDAVVLDDTSGLPTWDPPV